MRVASFHIDRFGTLGEQDVGGLSPGLNLFEGRNEAGKSTCLRFFKAMFFGYRRRMLNLDPTADARKSALGGGTLELLSDLAGPLRLTRRPGPHGGQLTLADSSGALLEETAALQLLGHMTPDLYDAIFAFSLRGLSDFSSLKGDSVRHALHGAAFGYVRPPAEALKILDARMKDLFKGDRGIAPINEALRELREVQANLRAREPDIVAYAALQSSLEQLEEAHALVQRERSDGEQGLRKLRRRLDLWQQWQEARAIQDELSGLEGPEGWRGPEFAPDAEQRLDALLARLEERRLAARQAENEHARLARELEELPEPAFAEDPALMLRRVQALREDRERRRAEAEQLTDLRLEASRLEQARARIGEGLGPGWDAGRIAATDHSLVAKEEMLRFGSELETRQKALDETQAECARVARDLEEAAAQRAEAQSRLEDSQSAGQDLPGRTETASLAAALAVARAALASLPRLRERRQSALQRSREALLALDLPASAAVPDEALPPVPPCAALEPLGSLAAVLAAAGNERALAAVARDSAAGLQEQAGAAQQSARLKLAGHQGLPEGQELEARQAQLRQLERLALDLEAAERERAALQNSLPALGGKALSGGRVANLLLNPMIRGGLHLILLGLGLCVGGLLAASADFLYSGGAIALGGLGMCCLCRLDGARSGSALERALAVAGERAQGLADERGALERRLAVWCPAADGTGSHRNMPERAARLLAELRQRALRREHDALEAERMTRELDSARMRAQEAEAALARAQGRMEQALEAWHDGLRQSGLPPSLAPERLALYEERLLAARALASASAEAGEALAAALAVPRACLEQAKGHAYFASALSAGGGGCAKPDASDADLTSGIEALSSALEALAGRDAAEQEGMRLGSVLEERVAACSRLEARLARAREAAAGAGHELDAARSAWTARLEERGLPAWVGPAAAAQAMENMALFVSQGRELENLHARRSAIVGALQGFARQCRDLAQSIALPAVRELDQGLPDNPEREFAAALHLLELLSLRVEAQASAAAVKERKKEQLHERELARARLQSALDAAHEELEAMLAAAGAADAEALGSAIGLFRRIQSLRDHERQLLAGLRRLAAEEGQSPEELLQAMGQNTHSLMRDEEARLAREQEELEGRAETLAGERGRLRERRDALAGSEESGLLRRREAALKADLGRLSRRWAVPALAKELLLGAKRRFEEEGHQGVVRFAGNIFAGLTDGEYSGIAALEDGSFAAVHRSGERRDPEKQLSRGTREQLYLALRLAYVKNHAAKAESVPLIMDDILVNFDPLRAARCAELLADFSRQNQILFFTCHPATAKLIAEAGLAAARQEPLPAPALYSVERGAIRPVKANSM